MSAHSSTKSAKRSSATLERRRSERKDYIFEAYVSSPTARPNEKKLDASSVNLSQHGVGFETLKPLPLDSFFILEIGFGDQRLVSEVRVVSCRKTDHGNYAIGAEFH